MSGLEPGLGDHGSAGGGRRRRKRQGIRISTLLNLGIGILFVVFLIGFMYGPAEADRVNGATILLTVLLLGTLLLLNNQGPRYERPLISLIVTQTILWVVVRLFTIVAFGSPLRYDNRFPAGAAEINFTVLFVVLGLIASVTGVRMGSLIWLKGGDRVRHMAEPAPTVSPRWLGRLILFGYVVVGYQIGFSYYYRAVLTEVGTVPFAAQLIVTLLNHDVTLLWLFAISVVYWRVIPRRLRMYLLLFFGVLISAYISKNFIIQLEFIFFYALLAKSDDQSVPKKAIGIALLSVLTFAPVYIFSFVLSQQQALAGTAGKTLNIMEMIDNVSLLSSIDYDSYRQMVFEAANRFDYLVMLLNFPPQGDYLGFFYCFKNILNVLAPGSPFADATQPQSVMFKVAYGYASWDDAMTSYGSDALPGLGIYHVYFGPVGAIVGVFLTCALVSWCYRKASAMSGPASYIGRTYVLYFFTYFLYGMGLDSLVSMLVYNATITTAIIVMFLKTRGVVLGRMPALLHARDPRGAEL